MITQGFSTTAVTLIRQLSTENQTALLKKVMENTPTEIAKFIQAVANCPRENDTLLKEIQIQLHNMDADKVHQVADAIIQLDMDQDKRTRQNLDQSLASFHTELLRFKTECDAYDKERTEFDAHCAAFKTKCDVLKPNPANPMKTPADQEAERARLETERTPLVTEHDRLVTERARFKNELDRLKITSVKQHNLQEIKSKATWASISLALIDSDEDSTKDNSISQQLGRAWARTNDDDERFDDGAIAVYWALRNKSTPSSTESVGQDDAPQISSAAPAGSQSLAAPLLQKSPTASPKLPLPYRKTLSKLENRCRSTWRRRLGLVLGGVAAFLLAATITVCTAGVGGIALAALGIASTIYTGSSSATLLTDTHRRISKLKQQNPEKKAPHTRHHHYAKP